MIKKLRIKWNEFKDAYIDCSNESVKVYKTANSIFILSITVLIIFIGIIFYDCLNLKTIAYTFLAIAFLYEMISFVFSKAYYLNLKICFRILDRILGKYGKVVTKDDWLRIKKNDIKKYKYLMSRKSLNYCYDCSRDIALFLEDAKLIYCSQKLANGTFSGHSVILKGNYVYDTNKKMHFTLDNFLKSYGVTVYKTFSIEEYSNENFFENIRNNWISWCNKNNVIVKFY